MMGFAVFAAGQARTTFEWGRIQSEWDWLAPLAVCALALAFVWYMYRRDSVELSRLTAGTLTSLRMAALVGLLLIYLQPQWRNETNTVANSRIELLADTSVSMTMTDGDSASSAGRRSGDSSPAAATRGQQLASFLEGSDFLAELRKKHDVVAWRFDQDASRVASLGKQWPAEPVRGETSFGQVSAWQGRNLLYVLYASLAAFAIGGVWFVVWREGRGQAHRGAALLTGAGALGVLVTVLLLAQQNSPRELTVLLGLHERRTASESTSSQEQTSEAAGPIDWKNELTPRGAETRMGQAVKQVLDEERLAPLAGVVLFTDGQQNAGLDPAAAVELAREADVPIFPVGMGSDREPVNVRVSDFLVPQRAYPGDKFTVTGYLQGQGLAGRTMQVKLYSLGAGAATADNPGTVAGEEQVTLGADGEVLAVKFELTPDEVGRRTLSLRVEAPPQDGDETDDHQEADVEVVDRKSKVLLFAGGPSREYQFLRNQLRRDKDVVVDVLLQTGQEGISQDANEILDEFPATREELFQYDCLVAFDPDWRELGPERVELERWVGDQAGGLVVIAGPIFTDTWAQDAALAKIRSLYPVEFQRRFANLDDARYGSREAWKIDFTREGKDAEFLHLADSAVASESAWQDFAGVFGYYSVRGPKPAATVYGHFSDPRAASSEGKPVYMAGQFFGSGRVFYLASGEMWRLRSVDEGYFERLYTNLIRFVAQGRLLRGSHRGVLLTEKDRYLVNSTVDVRAQLTDARLEPLKQASVTLEVIGPDMNLENVALAADPARAGNYRGQFAARSPGVYRLELPVPESQEERLTRRVQVRVSDLEREHTAQNKALLNEMAEKTGGKYYDGLNAVLGVAGGEPLAAGLRDQSRTITLPAQPDRLWDNRWMLALVCGLLSAEWLIRRLVKLA